MSGPISLLSRTVALSAALLLLTAGAAPAAPGGYRGGSPGAARGSYSGYRGGYSGYSGYRGGDYYRGGYYGGYRGGYYRGGYYGGYYPGYFSGVGIGIYAAPSYVNPVYPTPTYLYGAGSAVDAFYHGPNLADAPADQPQGPPPPDGTAAVGVHVPADAEVWFNGDATKQRGADREFLTPVLPVGRTYQYEIHARWTDNGRPVDQTRVVPVHSNERVEVDFTRPESVRPPLPAPAP